jgi:alpha-ketoglutarate-dependent taurine dioxygenase
MSSLQAKRGPLSGASRRPVDLSPADLVRTAPLAEGRFPLLATPGADVDLAAWVASNLRDVEGWLQSHGAVVFRGFGIRRTEQFEAVAGAICPDLYAEYGDLPREGTSRRVYKSTPYPADQMILFHNESSHLPRWPMKQLFFCEIAAESGGETPLLDCREVCRRLDPALLALFAEKGLTYVRNFTDGIDVPWRDFFRTEERSAVEEACRREGMDCEWKPNGLRVKHRTRAVSVHPKTSDRVFFNQIQLHHPACLDPAVRSSLEALFAPEDFPRLVTFGDGSPIPEETVRELGSLYDELAVSAPWQAGDIAVLDNMLVAHARKPFTGARKISVAMGEMRAA